MTVYFAASEPADINWVNPNDVTAVGNSTSGRDSTYSRGSFTRAGGRVYANIGASLSEFWCGFYWGDNNGSASYRINTSRVGIFDSSNQLICASGINSGLRPVMSSSFHASYTEPTVSRLGYFYMHCKMDPVNGFIRYYADQLLMYEFVGDTRGALGNAERVGFDNTVSSFSFWVGYYSQIMVADKDSPLIGAKLYTLPPTALGTDLDWTGLVTDVNHLGINDVTFMNAGTANAKQSFSLALPASIPSGLKIAGVKQVIRGAKDPDSTLTEIQPYLKVGNVNYNSGATFNLETTTGGAERVIYTNPATGNPWGVADLSGLEVGVEAK